jgi:hypothetical protein
MSIGGRVKRSLWAIGARIREPDMMYAFKAGMGTAILAAPAFFSTTRPVFTEYKGEWALISVSLTSLAFWYSVLLTLRSLSTLVLYSLPLAL